MIKFIVGIDTGINTGFAIYSPERGKLYFVASMMIHEAMERVLYEKNNISLVRVEDARQRKFITGGREKLQGAGSIKRDAKIWEDFLKDNSIPFEMVAPKNNKTKLNKDAFEKLTGYYKSTNEHGRDAAMLVFGYNLKV